MQELAQVTNSDRTMRPRWPILGFVAERFQVRNPIPLKILRVYGLLHAKSYAVAKRPPVGVEWKFGEGLPAQVSSSPSHRGSKLRGPSQVPLVLLHNGTLI
ncbi:hypothetical protein AVEN_274493-1 [Araneus ventricosus]|uniref:Uncharacterized protein n=1 Tax=Araneus ventricosus TaxID=182803 RepID=A0A4Y2X6C3_ARAVE|nr:hypothetical protein AVEN_274493-1 [Araneus ventricosus]